jgi:endonuclease/exonuclease/phosphatase family metal-dependent hydrolase
MKQISTALQDSVVLYTSGNFIQKRMAYRISQAISTSCGLNVTFGKEKLRRNAARLMMKDDKKLTEGKWRITVKGKTVTFLAGSYYGYYGISQFLASDEAADFYALTDGYVREGSFQDTVDLEPLKASCRYAYDKRGEVRVMFYNVLFGASTGMRKNEAGKAIKDVPPDSRNALQMEMIKQYCPDILGCQEFNISKRGERANEYGDLSALLAKIGYRESCPRDVGVHCYYNQTPLFYNTKTTKLIKSAYYWYEHQVDAENINNCSPNDCGSKALTWGVFEDKKTGKRYIAVSTHMATRSNGVRGLQAIEAVNVISSLVEKYNAPVFFGGDYNGRAESANISYFRGENARYADVAQDGLAEEFSSTASTHHTYPRFNEEFGFMLPDAERDCTIESVNNNNIDRILLTHAEGVKVGVYGVVIDECSMSASDHYPIFADVTL